MDVRNNAAGTTIDSAEKPTVEMIGDFPFMLSPVEAFIGFFSRVPF